MTNTITISGRLANDPKKVNTQTGKHCARFTVANQKDKDTTYFFDCVVYGPGADFLVQWFKKGAGIDVTGRLEYYDKEKDGKKYRNYQILALSIDFPVSKASAKTPEDDTKDLPW